MAEELYWIVLLTYKNRKKSSIPPADVVPDYHSVHKLEAVCCLIHLKSFETSFEHAFLHMQCLKSYAIQ